MFLPYSATLRGNTPASIPAQGSAVTSVFPHNTKRSKQNADELRHVLKRRLYNRERRALKRELREAFSETGAETFERPDGTSCITNTDTFERPDGTSCLNAESHLNVPVNEVVSVQLDIKELDIPYDIIIGRPSIMKYGLLQFDAQLCLAGLQNANTVIQPELLNQDPHVVPATESEADTKPEIGLQTPEDVAVEELNVALERLWMLSEREHWRHEISCPAVLTRAVQSLDGIAPPGAKLNVLREPKNGPSGVPADPVHNSVVRENRTRPDAALSFRGLTASPKWHHPKLDDPELNRAHKDQYIHYEASAVGI